jgi:hypothetical protein
VVRVEVLARSLAAREAVLQLGDERFNAGVPVVGTRELVLVRVPVVGQIDLGREVTASPQKELAASVALARTDGDDAYGERLLAPPLRAKGIVATCRVARSSASTVHHACVAVTALARSWVTRAFTRK